MLFLVALALAHPFSGKPGAGEPGSNIVGQRLLIRVEASRVEVEYVAEVPAIRVYREAKAEGADSTYAARKIEELRGNIHATWDGAPLPLTPVPIDAPARNGEGGFLELHARGEAAIGRAGTLHVRNGNYPDENAYFMSDVTLGPGVVATGSSLLTVVGSRARDNTHGAWVQRESARELDVTVRPAALWEVAEGDAKLPLRTEGLVPRRTWVFGLPVLVLVPALVFVVRRLRR